MALNVETGSAASTSESYASVSQADTYFSVRGFLLWATLSVNEKEQALRRSTDYMQQAYRGRWYGARVNATQALDWPRYLVPFKDLIGAFNTVPSFYSSTAIPTEISNACISMAYKAAAGDLTPDIQPQTTAESVGPISVSYEPGSRQTVRYQAMDKLLGPFLKDGGGGAMISVSRS